MRLVETPSLFSSICLFVWCLCFAYLRLKLSAFLFSSRFATRYVQQICSIQFGDWYRTSNAGSLITTGLEANVAVERCFAWYHSNQRVKVLWAAQMLFDCSLRSSALRWFLQVCFAFVIHAFAMCCWASGPTVHLSHRSAMGTCACISWRRVQWAMPAYGSQAHMPSFLTIVSASALHA
jgi:hypothetical protein